MAYLEAGAGEPLFLLHGGTMTAEWNWSEALPLFAERFRVDQVPSLALVVERRVVSRLEGRATAPRIESMLEPHLPETEPTEAVA